MRCLSRIPPGFPPDSPDSLHLNPVRKGLVAKREDWFWSSYNNFALDQTAVARCPIQFDYAHLPEAYRG